MTVKTYNNLIDEMKELADRLNKHYDTVTLETVEELDTPATETQRILNELKDKGVLKEEEMQEAWWDKKEPGKIEYDEIGEDAGSDDDQRFVHKQFMEVSNRLDWIAERFSEDSMLARKTGEIGGDTGGFGKVSQAADMLLSAIEELHRDAMGHIHQESLEVEEGYQTMPPIDKERYTELQGLEGPFMTLSGKVVYYDPKEGKYYDRDSDIYLDYDEWKAYDSKPDWSSKED
jgi:hypothetical protein